MTGKIGLRRANNSSMMVEKMPSAAVGAGEFVSAKSEPLCANMQQIACVRRRQSESMGPRFAMSES